MCFIKLMRCTDNLFIYVTYPPLGTIFKLTTTSCVSTPPVATYIKCTEGFVDITSYTLHCKCLAIVKFGQAD